MNYWLFSVCFCILSPHLLQNYLAHTALLTIIEEKCITNTSSAVAPIYNLDDNLWTEPEKFTQNVEYIGRKINLVKYCEASSPSSCFDDTWSVQSSLSSSRINNLITDRRWEEFPTFVTKYTDKYNKNMHYDKVTTLNSDNFVLPFSILIEKEAHLFLCDGPDVSSYNCYWFMIDAWDGIGSAIRACDAGDIKKIYDGGEAPYGICGSSTNYKVYTSILSKTKWTHLKIVSNNYILKLIDEEGSVWVKALNMKSMNIPKHVFIHSKRVNGMWKMHTFDYFYSVLEGKTDEFELFVGSGQRCISMLLAMCNKCTMVIEVLVYYGNIGWNSIILYSRELQNDENKNWQEHKLHFNTENKTVYFRILKKGNEAPNKFWAISDIRSCETNELRMTQIDDQSKWTRKCQHLATGEIMDLGEPKIEKLENSNKCGGNQFGEDCISCKTIFGQNTCPRQFKYCQLVVSEDFNSLSNKCYCSIGFDGPNCNASIIFVFAQEPKIEPEYTSCNLTLKSFDGTGIESRMEFYKFQYRKQGQSEWKNTISVPFNEFRMIEITGLEIQSIYELRMFGYKDIPNMDEMRFIENENLLPTYTFQTICRVSDSSSRVASSSGGPLIMIMLLFPAFSS